MGLLNRDERRTLVALLEGLPFTRTVEGRRGLLRDLGGYARDTGLSRSDFNVADIVALVDGETAAPLADGTWPVILLLQNALDDSVGDRRDDDLRNLLSTAQGRINHLPAQERTHHVSGLFTGPVQVGNHNSQTNQFGGPAPNGPRALAPALPLNVQDRLRGLIGGLPAFSSGDGLQRISFLRRAGLSDTLLGNYPWHGPPAVAAGQVLDMALQVGQLLGGGRPGYTVLGAVLDQMLREDAVGLTAGLDVAGVIRDYALIDLGRAEVSAQLRTLVGQLPPSAAPPDPPANPSTSRPTDPLASRPAEAAAGSVRAAFNELFGTLDEIGNSELLDKARELRAAFAQTDLDLEHITSLRYWFRGRPPKVRTAAEAFFTNPAVGRRMAQALQDEIGGA